MTKYEIDLRKTDDVYYMECNSAIIDGKQKFLHNEIGCSFVVENGDIRLLSGWHIGAGDYEWREGEGGFQLGA